MGHFMHKHHFHSKKSENGADSRKCLCVQTPGDSGCTASPIYLRSYEEKQDPKVLSYRSMALNSAALLTSLSSQEAHVVFHDPEGSP